MLSWTIAERCRVVSVAVIILCGAVDSARSENWPRFRGADGSGVSEQTGFPTTWTSSDYIWNVELPGVGHSSPVIWQHRLFVTSAIDEGAERHLVCLDARSGQEIWSRLIGMNRSHKHLKSSWASSSPVTDGQKVYVSFADKELYSVATYDFDGNLLWRRNLGSFESQHGLGVSPILFEDMVIACNDQDGPSSVVALDRETGSTRWSVLRKIDRVSYSTPVVISGENRRPQLICVSGASGIASLDPYSGHQNWITEPFPLRTVASPVLAGGLVIASCGQGGRYGVLQVAVDPNPAGEQPAGRVVWERKKLIPYVPSPIFYRGYLYEWSDEGIVVCVNCKDGQDVWTERIGGNYSGSPICVGGKLYGLSENGEVIVLAAAPTFEYYGKTELGDPSHSTPAVANGRLYFRTFHRLMCLKAESTTAAGE